MNENYQSAVGKENFSATLKLLDGAITLASKEYELALQKLAQLHINRAYCNQKLQLIRKALKDYDAALKLTPNCIKALHGKGQALFKLKKVEEARAVWQQAVQVADPTCDIEVLLEVHLALKNMDPEATIEGPLGDDCLSPDVSVPDNLGKEAVQLNGIAETALQQEDQGPAMIKVQDIDVQMRAGPSTKDPTEPGVASLSIQPEQPPGVGKQSPSAVEKNRDKQSEDTAARTKKSAFSSRTQQESSSRSATKLEKVDFTCSPAKRTQGVLSGEALQKALGNSTAINIAVLQINAGKVAEAEAVLNEILKDNPNELGALVARGTARALARKLEEAVVDFSRAIEVEPRYPDNWKRRGQARSALGEVDGALIDLQKCIELLPMFDTNCAASQADCYLEKGLIYQKCRDYQRACRELRRAVQLDRKNVQAWNLLGLCCTSQGDIQEGVSAYEQALEMNDQLKEAWLNLGQVLKEEGRVKEAERAFTRAIALGDHSQSNLHALRILAQMRQGQGNHAGAVKLLDKAIKMDREEVGMVECLFLRGACNHALGYHKEAVRDYEACLGWNKGNISDESRTFQFLAFYQKEMALYLHHSLDRKVVDFCPDNELPSLLKELWCKKAPPTQELISSYHLQPPISMSSKRPPLPDLSQLKSLTDVADRMGGLLQNHHQGFLSNTRQQRAAGYAAIELSQALEEVVEAQLQGRDVWVNSEGSSGQGGCSGRHRFGWRDAQDIVVKWRQLAEPNDQVVWVDLLTRREFEQGFGSHTPMYSGQTKCVRYYMNFSRALELQKKILLELGHAYDANNQPIPLGSDDKKELIRRAKSAEDMYLAIGKDSWVVVPIASLTTRETTLEGTRLTLVKLPNQPDAFEFSIRTPVTPPRWKDFDRELEAGFERVIRARIAGDYLATAQSIMYYTYYWYNFMPLARGTAAVGYTTLLAMFWSAAMPVTRSIPKDCQVDWEAILTQHPDDFISSVSSWLYPVKAQGSAPETARDKEDTEAFPPSCSLPKVSEFLATPRLRLEALNGSDARRI